MPTAKQLKARLNPTPFTINVPKEGLFRAVGGFGDTLYRRTPQGLKTFDITKLGKQELIKQNPTKDRYGNYNALNGQNAGSQASRGVELLKKKYGFDIQSLPEVNLADLYQEFQRQGLGYQRPSGSYVAPITNVNDINKFLNVNPAQLQQKQRNTQQNKLADKPQIDPTLLAFNQAIASGDIAKAKSLSTTGKQVDTTTPQGTPLSDPSIVNFLNAQGKPSDFNTRATLAKNAGITNYTGTAEQNTQLLSRLRQQTKQTLPTDTTSGLSSQDQQAVINAGIAGGLSRGEATKIARGNTQSATGLPKIALPPKKISSNDINLPISDTQNIHTAFINSSQSNLDTNRKTLESTLQTQIDEINKQMEESKKSIQELSTLQANGVKNVESLLQPFREKLQNAEREKLFINKNFQDNQKLVDELGSLLTQGNELIAQQKEITGLRAIRNPRIDKTISDVNARAGVIQAVINARNGQIAQAQTMIDRSINVITADKKDQLNYYHTLKNFYEGQKDTAGKKLVVLDKTKTDFLKTQIGLLEGDLAQSQANAQHIKDLMLNPKTALFMAKAGVSLNDSPETVNAKMVRQSQIQDTQDQQAKITSGIKDVLKQAIKAGADIATQQRIIDSASVEEALSVASPALGELSRQKIKSEKPTPQTIEKPMSTNQIDTFRRNYGWTPPFGFTQDQVIQFQNDNPNLTPQELQAEASKVANGEVSTQTSTDTTQTPTTNKTAESVVSFVLNTMTDSQLKSLKKESDNAGISSFFKTKRVDVKNYLNSPEIKQAIQDALSRGASKEDILSALAG